MRRIISLLLVPLAIALPGPGSTDLRVKRYHLNNEQARQVQEAIQNYQEERARIERSVPVVEKMDRATMPLLPGETREDVMRDVDESDSGTSEESEEEIDKQTRNHRLGRAKREWFATMSPEEYRDRLTLLEMSIKKKHH